MSSLYTLSREQLYDRGLTADDLVASVHDLVKIYVPNYDFKPEKFKENILSQEYMFDFLIDPDMEDKIVGYGILCSITPEAYDIVMKGLHRDGYPEANTKPLEGDINLWVSGFLVDRPYRPRLGLKYVADAMIESCRKLIRQGVNIKNIVARGLTKDGQRICENIGMMKVRPHVEKGVIYQFNLGISDPVLVSPVLAPIVQEIQNKSV
jgi:hypothetical protein